MAARSRIPVRERFAHPSNLLHSRAVQGRLQASPIRRNDVRSAARGRPQLGSVARGGPQVLLDAQQLIVLGDAIGAAGGAGLDLAGVGGYRDVGDGRVLRLTAAMADDGGE